MQRLLSAIVIVALVSSVHCGPFGLFGSSATTTPASSGSCQLKEKQQGLIGKAVNTVGKAVGGVVGGLWGAIMPTSVNQGSIAAASGDASQDQSGNKNVVSGATNLAGKAIGGTWGLVVPNSVRCGSIAAAKATGNVGTSKEDPACSNMQWVDDNGQPCTPPPEDANQISDTVKIAYSSNSDRDKKLQQILSVWKDAMAQYSVSNMEIKLIDAKNGPKSGTKYVAYVITYSGDFVDPGDAVNQFRITFKSEPVSGVQLVEDTTNASGETVGDVQITQKGSSFTITGSLTMIFTSSDDQDQAMNNLLDLWTQVLKKYNVQKATIKVTSSGSTFNTPSTLTYSVTGTAKGTIDAEAAKQDFLDQAGTTTFRK